MSAYGDLTEIKELSGVSPSDFALSDRSDSDTGVDEDDLDDLIGELNEQASSRIEEFCNRDFELHSGVTETLDGNGRMSMRLPGYPVQSISSVKVGTKTLSSDEYRVKDSPTRPGQNAGILERKHAPWPEGWENIEVTYDWGYQSPPGVVVGVANELVVDVLLWAVQNDQLKGLSSMSMDGFSAQVPEGRLELSADQQQRLKTVSRVVAV